MAKKGEVEIKDDGRKKGVSKLKTPLVSIVGQVLYGPGVSKPEGEVTAITIEKAPKKPKK